MKEIKSRDGRTYTINEKGKVMYIQSEWNATPTFPYTWLSKCSCWNNRSGELSYKYLRLLDAAGKIRWES